jgi:outer membrane protein OmpA-like peptidoglycan-associated protein
MVLKMIIIGVIVMRSLLSFSQTEINFTAMPERLSDKVNTIDFNETNPKITADGSRLYFVRWNHPENFAEHDIWYSDYINGSWSLATHMSAPLSNKGGSNTAVQTIFPDGNTMMLFGYYSRISDAIKPGFSIVKRDKKGWGFPIPQLIEKLANKSYTVGYCLAPSGNQAIISVVNKGMGGHDLFVTFKTKKKNTWSKPLNMGKIINSNGDESTPFLSADGKTLFFSSDGHGGYGSKDIFMSKRLDDTWINWSEPINLGPKINSEEYDAYFSIDAAGEYAYFISSKESSSDIYRILMPNSAKPEPLLLISGKVINQKTEEALSSKITYYNLETGEEIGYANSDPLNGNYKIALPRGEKYAFYAESNNFYTIRENLDLMELDTYKEIEKNLYLAPIEKGEVIRLNNIFFEFGKATLLAESNKELDKLKEVLDENPKLEIRINGHTDNVGSSSDNQDLSESRAKAVYDYLIKKGIKGKRLSYQGFGEDKAIDSNDTEIGRARNRRVEFEIL